MEAWTPKQGTAFIELIQPWVLQKAKGRNWLIPAITMCAFRRMGIRLK